MYLVTLLRLFEAPYTEISGTLFFEYFYQGAWVKYTVDCTRIVKKHNIYDRVPKRLKPKEKDILFWA